MNPPSITGVYAYARTFPNKYQITIEDVRAFIVHMNINRPAIWTSGDWKDACVMWFCHGFRGPAERRRLASAVALALATD